MQPLIVLTYGSHDTDLFFITGTLFYHIHVDGLSQDGLVRDCSNSFANAMELLQSLTKLSI